MITRIRTRTRTRTRTLIIIIIFLIIITMREVLRERMQEQLITRIRI